jgi:hypothetical protein
MPSAKSSSAKAMPPAGRRHGAALARSREVSAPPLDQDARDALDFARRGRPEAEIGYSENAPKLTAEQLAEFEPASIQFTKRKR